MQEQIFRGLLLRRGWVLLGCLLLVAWLGAGLPRLVFDNDYRMFFSPENPQLQAFEALQNTYTKSDNLLFVLVPRSGQVFSRDSLAAVEALTEQAWRIPYSLRVDSLTNFQHSYAEGDDLIVEPLVEAAAGLSDAELERVRRIALAEPLLLDRLIAPDGTVTGVNVIVQLPGKRIDEVPKVAASARELAARMERDFPQMEIRLTGLVIMNNAFPEASRADMQTLYPLMFGIVLVTLALLLRSVSATLATLLVVILMVVATMGAAGRLGILLSPATVTVPVILLTLGIADCVHVLINFLHRLRDGLGRREAMLDSLRINLEPIFLTSLTTAVGFLSLNFSEVPPFRDLGNLAAIGVGLAYLLSVSFLPALMMFLPLRAPRGDTPGNLSMLRLADWVIRRRRLLLWGMGGLTLLLIAQIPRNELNDQFVKYFDQSFEFRRDTDFATEHLTGIYRVEYSFPSGEPGGINEPAYLERVEAFANWYRVQPEVLHVSALTDIVKRLNRNLHGDDPAWYRLPESRELAAQYLLLYELSLPFGLSLNDQIDVDRSATRVGAILQNLTTNQMLALEARAQAWLRAHLPPGLSAEGSSAAVIFSHIGARNIRAMLKGAFFAMLLIAAVLVIALRSLRIGLLSMLPNLVPLAMAFGLWGLLVGQVGLALSVVTGITLGIVVDDTVHFLSKYLRARRELGKSVAEAVRHAFATVGTALWVTSLVLVLGFSVLALSNFELNAGMGLLTALTIALALAADFLLLPALLLQFGGKSEEITGPAA